MASYSGLSSETIFRSPMVSVANSDLISHSSVLFTTSSPVRIFAFIISPFERNLSIAVLRAMFIIHVYSLPFPASYCSMLFHIFTKASCSTSWAVCSSFTTRSITPYSTALYRVYTLLNACLLFCFSSSTSSSSLYVDSVPSVVMVF